MMTVGSKVAHMPFVPAAVRLLTRAILPRVHVY